MRACLALREQIEDQGMLERARTAGACPEPLHGAAFQPVLRHPTTLNTNRADRYPR